MRRSFRTSQIGKPDSKTVDDTRTSVVLFQHSNICMQESRGKRWENVYPRTDNDYIQAAGLEVLLTSSCFSIISKCSAMNVYLFYSYFFNCPHCSACGVPQARKRAIEALRADLAWCSFPVGNSNKIYRNYKCKEACCRVNCVLQDLHLEVPNLQHLKRWPYLEIGSLQL